MDRIKAFFRGDRYAAHSGIEVVEITPGRARARMVLQPFHLNGLSIAHGGTLFTLADFAFALASNSHGTVAVAVNASISIMKATTEGTLWAEAREVSKNHRLGHLHRGDSRRRRRTRSLVPRPGLPETRPHSGVNCGRARVEQPGSGLPASRGERPLGAWSSTRLASAVDYRVMSRPRRPASHPES